MLGPNNIGGVTPNKPGVVFPDGVARVIRGHHDIVLQMHYTTNGTAATDRTEVGVIFAKEPPSRQAAGGLVLNPRFTIPPNDGNYEVRGVNVLAPPKSRLAIEVVHDLVCPWCYLGVRRLFRTLRRRPDLLVELAWRPFLLNPDMPRGGMSRADYVVRKFGGEERARRLYSSITELGRAESVAFRFDRIRRTPSSVDAHRLVRWAARHGRAGRTLAAGRCIDRS